MTPMLQDAARKNVEWKEKNMNGNRGLGSEKLVPQDIQAIFVNIHIQVALVIFLTTAGI